MKTLISILAFQLLTFSALAQDKAISIDTFHFTPDFFFSSVLLLSSDSSFYIADGSHTEVSISKGKWSKNKDKITLTGISDSTIKFQVSIETNSCNQDSIQTFLFSDCYGNPMANYFVYFLDSAFNEYREETNSNGILKIRKSKYLAFYSKTEKEIAKVEAFSKDKIHFIPGIVNSILVKTNYPSLMLITKNVKEVFSFSKREFILVDKELIDKKNNERYYRN
jgi:hypothetical protein